MDKTASLPPIDEFLAQAEKRLRGRLLPEKLAATLAEAYEHLSCRAEDLAAEGMTPAEAEAAAAEAFGKPREWTREILIAENTKPYLKLATGISIAGFTLYVLAGPIVFAMVVAMFIDMRPVVSVVSGVASIIVPLMNTGLMAAAFGALIARRCAFKPAIAILAAVALLNFCVFGISATPLYKMVTLHRELAQTQDSIKIDVMRLEEGVKFYGSSRLPGAPPDTLKTNHGFVSPIRRDHPVSWAAVAKGSTEFVSTEAVAARRWRDFGAQRLAECRQSLIDISMHPVNHMTVRKAVSTFHVRNFSALMGLAGSGITLFYGFGCMMLCSVCGMSGWFFRRVVIAFKSDRPANRSPAT